MLPFCGRSGGSIAKKIKGSAQGNWDHREGQQPFRPNSNGAGDRTTTLRRLLTGTEHWTSLNKSKDCELSAQSVACMRRGRAKSAFDFKPTLRVQAMARTAGNKTMACCWVQESNIVLLPRQLSVRLFVTSSLIYTETMRGLTL